MQAKEESGVFMPVFGQLGGVQQVVIEVSSVNNTGGNRWGRFVIITMTTCIHTLGTRLICGLKGLYYVNYVCRCPGSLQK